MGGVLCTRPSPKGWPGRPASPIPPGPDGHPRQAPHPHPAALALMPRGCLEPGPLSAWRPGFPRQARGAASAPPAPVSAAPALPPPQPCPWAAGLGFWAVGSGDGGRSCPHAQTGRGPDSTGACGPAELAVRGRLAVPTGPCGAPSGARAGVGGRNPPVWPCSRGHFPPTKCLTPDRGVPKGDLQPRLPAWGRLSASGGPSPSPCLPVPGGPGGCRGLGEGGREGGLLTLRPAPTTDPCAAGHRATWGPHAPPKPVVCWSPTARARHGLEAAAGPRLGPAGPPRMEPASGPRDWKCPVVPGPSP